MLFKNEQQGWQQYEEDKVIARFAPIMVEYYMVEDFKKLLLENK